MLLCPLFVTAHRSDRRIVIDGVAVMADRMRDLTRHEGHGLEITIQHKRPEPPRNHM